MKQRHKQTGYTLGVLLLSSFALSGCFHSDSDSDSDSNTAPASFEVTVVNATNNQPLSPVVVVAHTAAFSIWTVGTAASTELENIAEGGSNAELLASLAAADAATASGTGPIGSGGTETITVTTDSATQTLISVATMLVNTNDAFSGLRSIDISGMAIGDSMMFKANAYDAGTELNSESLGTMPGPADGGEGFNAARTDISDVVRGHGGVVTADDGLGTSVLDQSHRFDNPAMMVTITRI